MLTFYIDLKYNVSGDYVCLNERGKEKQIIFSANSENEL